MIIVSIDPGTVSGAMCVDYGTRIETVKITDVYPTRFWATIEVLETVDPELKVIVEDVPISCGKGKGIGSVKLNKQMGYIVGYLEAKNIRYTLVTPKKWSAGLKTRKNYNDRKEDLYQHAKLRYPDLKFPKYAADAVLILDWYKSQLKCGSM